MSKAVHGGNWREDTLPQDTVNSTYRDPGYDSATHALDDAIANITAELQAKGLWDNTLMVVTSDNGGDCGLPDQPHEKGAPGSASNFPVCDNLPAKLTLITATWQKMHCVSRWHSGCCLCSWRTHPQRQAGNKEL